MFSPPKETTKSSIPNVEYSGAFSNKEADLYSAFQAWLLYTFSASFHVAQTHFNSIFLAINILVQNVIPSSWDTLFSDLWFPFVSFPPRLYLLYISLKIILTLHFSQAPLAIPFLFYTIFRNFLSFTVIKKKSLMLTLSLPYAGFCYNCFTCINSILTTPYEVSTMIEPCFTEEETEAQRH